MAGLTTVSKRASSQSSRWGRLPFGRRFTQPIPDSTIDQGDRQQAAFAYSGIAAASLDASVIAMVSVLVRAARGGRFDFERSARPTFHVEPILFPGMFDDSLQSQRHAGTGRPPNP